MATRIAAVLGVKPDEAQRIFILFGASFFLGGALLFFYTSSNAIFLTEFDADTLPYVYIVNSVFVIIFGYIYAAIEKRTSLLGLLTGSLTILTATIFIFWLTLQFAHSRLVIFVMMTWFRLIFIYTTLGLWELASAVFDVRQAKRLFALVSLGLLLAFIIGGLSTSLITQVTATVNLLLLSAIFLLLYAGVLIKLAPSLGEATKTEPNTPPFPVRAMFKDNYISLIFALKTITIINYYIVEFIFYKQAAARYPAEEGLANFLGTFIGLSTLGMALIAALLTGRYITRFGLRIALLTMPTVLLITAFLSGSYGLLIGISNTVFFMLAISIKFSNEVLEKSLHIPALGVLYQPIPRYKRMPVRVAVEGWWGSVALIGSGILLLFFNQLPNVKITFFIVLSFITTALYAGITAWVYRHYQNQLKKAVTARFLSGVALPAEALDETFIQSELYSDHPGKVLAALQYSAQLGDHPEKPLLLDLLDHTAPEVQLDVLQRIVESDFQPAKHKVQEIVENNHLPVKVRGQALISLAALDGIATPQLMKYLDTDLSQYAIPALIKYGGEAGYALAHSQIDDWAHSSTPKQRLLAAEFVAQLPDATDILVRLLKDTSPQVKRRAIQSAEHHLKPTVIVLLLAELKQAHFASLIQHVLAQGDAQVVSPIQQQFDDFPEKLQPRLLTICAEIGTPEAEAFLLEFLDRPVHDTIYDAALAGLATMGYQQLDIFPLLEQEQTNAVHILSAYQATDELLQRALRFDFQRLQQRIFSILSLAYDIETIRHIERALQQGDTEQKANALELLEVTITKPIKTLIFSLVEDSNLQARAASLTLETVTNPLETIARNGRPFSAWTQFCVSYLTHVGQEADNSMYSLIEKVMILRSVSIFAQTPDPILAEIAPVLREEQANAGDVLIEKGTTGNRLFIIVEGQVHVHDGKLTDLHLGSREIVGELAVLDPAPRSATVTAEAPTTYFVLEADVLHELMSNNPEINQGVIKVLVQRIRRLDEAPAN